MPTAQKGYVAGGSFPFWAVEAGFAHLFEEMRALRVVAAAGNYGNSSLIELVGISCALVRG